MTWHDTSAWAALVPAVGLLIVILGIAYRVVRGAVRMSRRLVHFLDDFNGEPARPGQPARPGIAERIEAIEHEFKPNAGKTMKDAMIRLEVQGERVERKAEAAARLAADSAERTNEVLQQHIWHQAKFHGEDRRHYPPTPSSEDTV